MAETGKKVEVRYGAFACRVEGFDDPVAQLREVLSLMQRIIAETPALADEHSGLDDAQFARIGEALADRRSEDDMPGLVVIRSGDRVTGDIEDAEIPAVAWRDDDANAMLEDSPADAPRADAVPYPLAALYAAPAAARAEAAFAAGVASEGDVPSRDESGSQGPHGVDEPEEPTTPAALFAAPAAGVAEAAFSHDLSSSGRAADPDDDAGAPDLAYADEAAEERAPVDDDEHAPAAADDGSDESPAPSEPEPAAATSNDTPPDLSWSDAEEDGGRAEGETEDAAIGRKTRAPASYSKDAESGAEPMPAINIFASPPDEAAATEPPGTAENRLAALITRYQGGLHADREAAPETAPEAGPAARTAGRLSATDLVERAEATEVDELLAVTAAWLTLSGGRPQFTRREVMEVFETLPGRHPRTLEARIKGFGQLVRSGTLQLVGDGAFALAPREQARFRALIDQG